MGNYYYGQGHVMKPNRIRMTHHLLLNYGIYRHMKIFVIKNIKKFLQKIFQRPFPASFEDMTRFHSEDYMNFLKSATPENLKHYNKQMLKCVFKINFENIKIFF